MWVPRWLNNVFLTYKYQLQEYIYLRRKLDDQCRCVKEVKSPTRAEITKTGQYKRNILVIEKRKEAFGGAYILYCLLIAVLHMEISRDIRMRLPWQEEGHCSAVTGVF